LSVDAKDNLRIERLSSRRRVDDEGFAFDLLADDAAISLQLGL